MTTNVDLDGMAILPYTEKKKEKKNGGQSNDKVRQTFDLTLNKKAVERAENAEMRNLYRQVDPAAGKYLTLTVDNVKKTMTWGVSKGEAAPAAKKMPKEKQEKLLPSLLDMVKGFLLQCSSIRLKEDLGFLPLAEIVNLIGLQLFVTLTKQYPLMATTDASQITKLLELFVDADSSQPSQGTKKWQVTPYEEFSPNVESLKGAIIQQVEDEALKKEALKCLCGLTGLMKLDALQDHIPCPSTGEEEMKLRQASIAYLTQLMNDLAHALFPLQQLCYQNLFLQVQPLNEKEGLVKGLSLAFDKQKNRESSRGVHMGDAFGSTVVKNLQQLKLYAGTRMAEFEKSCRKSPYHSLHPLATVDHIVHQADSLSKGTRKYVKSLHDILTGIDKFFYFFAKGKIPETLESAFHDTADQEELPETREWAKKVAVELRSAYKVMFVETATKIEEQRNKLLQDFPATQKLTGTHLSKLQLLLVKYLSAKADNKTKKWTAFQRDLKKEPEEVRKLFKTVSTICDESVKACYQQLETVFKESQKVHPCLETFLPLPPAAYDSTLEGLSGILSDNLKEIVIGKVVLHDDEEQYELLLKTLLSNEEGVGVADFITLLKLHFDRLSKFANTEFSEHEFETYLQNMRTFRTETLYKQVGSAKGLAGFQLVEANIATVHQMLRSLPQIQLTANLLCSTLAPILKKCRPKDAPLAVDAISYNEAWMDSIDRSVTISAVETASETSEEAAKKEEVELDSELSDDEITPSKKESAPSSQEPVSPFDTPSSRTIATFRKEFPAIQSSPQKSLSPAHLECLNLADDALVTLEQQYALDYLQWAIEIFENSRTDEDQDTAFNLVTQWWHLADERALTAAILQQKLPQPETHNLRLLLEQLGLKTEGQLCVQHDNTGTYYDRYPYSYARSKGGQNTPLVLRHVINPETTPSLATIEELRKMLPKIAEETVRLQTEALKANFPAKKDVLEAVVNKCLGKSTEKQAETKEYVEESLKKQLAATEESLKSVVKDLSAQFKKLHNQADISPEALEATGNALHHLKMLSRMPSLICRFPHRRHLAMHLHSVLFAAQYLWENVGTVISNGEHTHRLRSYREFYGLGEGILKPQQLALIDALGTVEKGLEYPYQHFHKLSQKQISKPMQMVNLFYTKAKEATLRGEVFDKEGFQDKILSKCHSMLIKTFTTYAQVSLALVKHHLLKG